MLILSYFESIRNFLATLKGYAKLCEYKVKCTSCSKEIDYSNEIILDQLVRGINDKEILADLLGETKTDLTLLEVVEYVARKELARSEQSTVSSEMTNAVRSSRSKNVPSSCWACLGKSHDQQNSFRSRKDKCPAWDHECDKCSKKGHYSKACRQCTSSSKWGTRMKRAINVRITTNTRIKLKKPLPFTPH